MNLPNGHIRRMAIKWLLRGLKVAEGNLTLNFEVPINQSCTRVSVRGGFVQDLLFSYLCWSSTLFLFMGTMNNEREVYE